MYQLGFTLLLAGCCFGVGLVVGRFTERREWLSFAQLFEREADALYAHINMLERKARCKTDSHGKTITPVGSPQA